MKLVQHILKLKGYDVWSVSPDATVYYAIKLMSDKGVGALPVLRAGKLIGVISERDYTRKVILKGRSSKDTKVREIMSSPAIYVTPDEPIERCMALMTEKRLRHLPVLEGDGLVGIVSIGDLVKAIISDQETLIRDLEQYILEHTSIT